MNNVLIIGIITVAIIIAVVALMLISQKSSQPSLAVMPGSITEQPSSQPSLAVMPGSITEQPFIVYSGVNFTGESLELPGPGKYPLDPECGTGKIIPFKPKSVKMPDKYRIGLLGDYRNPGDTKCGPSIIWTTDPSQFSDLNKAFTPYIYANVNGSVIIEDKNTKRYREDRYY